MELQLQHEAEAEADSLAWSGVHACSVSSSRPHMSTDEKERRPLRSAACFILSLYSKFNSIGGTHIPQQKVGSIPNRLPSSVKHNSPPPKELRLGSMAEGQKQSQKQSVHFGKQYSRSRTWHGRRKDNIERLKNAPRYQFTGSQKHGGRMGPKHPGGVFLLCWSLFCTNRED